MHQIRVGVLRGGPSSEYDVSLRTGASMLQHLPQDKYEAKDILIDKEGVWHLRGLPIAPHRAIQQFDVALLGFHGAYGEDGTVQKFLHTHGVPFTGSDALASGIAMNKLLTKKQAEVIGLTLAPHFILEVTPTHEQELIDRFRSMSPPFVVKPIDSGSSVGVSVVKTFDQFESAVRNAFEHSSRILVEQFVFGREATCGVVDDFRDEEIYTLPPVEIVPPKEAGFFNLEVKYNGKTLEICPGNFSFDEKRKIQDAARAIHKQLGLRHYSRSDFIVTPRGKIYFLEVNTLPGLTPESLLPKSLEAVGFSFADFLDHIIRLALAGK
jgi:D-alanine-D-alanine ligase